MGCPRSSVALASEIDAKSCVDYAARSGLESQLRTDSLRIENPLIGRSYLESKRRVASRR